MGHGENRRSTNSHQPITGLKITDGKILGGMFHLHTLAPFQGYGRIFELPIVKHSN